MDWSSLIPKGSGAEGEAVMIDRYGKVRSHASTAEANSDDAVRLYNVQIIEVRNLEITNRGRAPAKRRGVHIFRR